MSRPTVDQASKQNFVVNIQDSEFGKLVVWWCERDIGQKNVPNFVVLFGIFLSISTDL